MQEYNYEQEAYNLIKGNWLTFLKTIWLDFARY